MERHTFTTNFWVSSSKMNKNGLAPITATITLNGERASFSTGKSVKPEEWEVSKQKVKGTSDTAKSINETLLQIRNKIYRKEAELMERGYIINASILRDACLDKINALQSKTLCQIFDEYLAGQSDAVGISISSDTFYNYSRALVLLKEYMRQKFDRADIALLELNYSFIDGFSTFLRKEYSQRKNTAVKYLRWLKRMVNMAIANRHLKFDPFINFKVQREVVDKVF